MKSLGTCLVTVRTCITPSQYRTKTFQAHGMCWLVEPYLLKCGREDRSDSNSGVASRRPIIDFSRLEDHAEWRAWASMVFSSNRILVLAFGILGSRESGLLRYTPELVLNEKL